MKKKVVIDEHFVPSVGIVPVCSSFKILDALPHLKSFYMTGIVTDIMLAALWPDQYYFDIPEYDFYYVEVTDDYGPYQVGVCIKKESKT